MSKGAKNPNRTGMRCIICYAYEFYTDTSNGKNQKKAKVKTDHETYCPDYRP